MLEITFYRRDYKRTAPIQRSICSKSYLAVLHANSLVSIYESPREDLIFICEFQGQDFMDLAFFDHDKIAVVSRSRSTVTLFSVSKKMLLLESAVPSQSMSNIWCCNKNIFISDEENLFVMTFKDDEFKLKLTHQLKSKVKAFCATKSGAFICALSDGKICFCDSSGEKILIEYSSAVNTINRIPSSEAKFAFGFQDGDVRQVKLDHSTTPPTISVGASLIDETSNKNGVINVFFGDFDGDGEFELGLLRYDNTFQIWQLLHSQPLLRYESKQASNFGNIVDLHVLKNKRRDDILLMNYTGWIFSLITDRSKVKPLSLDDFKVVRDDNKKMKSQLGERLLSSNSAYIKPMDVKLKTDLKKLESVSYYKLVIECEMAIEIVQICCDVAMNIIEDEKDSDVNQAVFSKIEGNPLYPVIFTFRCQSNTQRLQVNLRPVEGFSGDLQLFVFPDIQGNKIAIRRVFKIPALSLYSRCFDFINFDSSSSLLNITGDFSISLIRDWLAICVEDLPNDKIEDCCYRNAFTQSYLKLTMDSGSCKIVSNNVSSLIVIRDNILAKSTQGNIQIEIIPKFNQDSTVQLIKGLIDRYGLLSCSLQTEEYNKILHEIVLQEGSETVIPDNHRKSLARSREVEQISVKTYEQLSTIIYKLFVDNAKFSGKPISQDVQKFEDLLDRKDFKNILLMFA